MESIIKSTLQWKLYILLITVWAKTRPNKSLSPHRVVQKLLFKIYDCEVYRHPPASEKQYSYIHCSRLMTQDLNKLPVIWEKEELYGDSLLRRRVRQHFKAGWYTGRVTLYNSRTKLYTINYDDGDSETMNLNALLQALRP